MRFFARFAPGRAYRDLRGFLAQRRPHELLFLVLAVAVTGAALALFARNDYPIPYKPPEVIYVQQWRLDRSEAEILAQQKVDQAKKAKEDAELKRFQDEKRASFKKVDDALKRWGL